MVLSPGAVAGVRPQRPHCGQDHRQAQPPHPRQGPSYGYIALGYGVLEAFEAYGLWRRRRWGEYLTIIATALLLIPEVDDRTTRRVGMMSATNAPLASIPSMEWSSASHVASAGFACLAIGLALTAVHLIGIPLDGTSVNPARSLGPALIVGGAALSQLWVFIVAPLIGGLLAAGIWRLIIADRVTEVAAGQVEGTDVFSEMDDTPERRAISEHAQRTAGRSINRT